jgi:hypothetical protein
MKKLFLCQQILSLVCIKPEHAVINSRMPNEIFVLCSLCLQHVWRKNISVDYISNVQIKGNR